MDQDNNVQAAIDAGVKSATLDVRFDSFTQEEVANGDVPLVLLNGDQKLVVPTELLKVLDERADAPRRRQGTARFIEVESLIAHVNRFKNTNSVIFVDPVACTVTAVIDYNEKVNNVPSSEGGAIAVATSSDAPKPRWGRHRDVYACPMSRQWKLWTENAGKLMSQSEFALFIEANIRDLMKRPAEATASKPGEAISDAYATPAQLITMARQLQVRSAGNFESTINETTGEYTLKREHNHTSDSTPIPRAFQISIPIFEGGDDTPIEARIRFVLEGTARFAYTLFETEEIKRLVFAKIRTKVAAETGLPVYAGAPEA